MVMKRVNAVVVGAGAGGGIVAKELAEAGLSVVLLERGKWYTAFDCRKDDLRNQRTSVLGCGFGPDDERNRRVFVDPQGHERVVLPSDGVYGNNAACVGGGTASYGAMAWRYMEKDFRMRSTYGPVANSTLDDWPISYADLEPFYEKAEWEIGVSGDDTGNPFRAPRKKPLPMPPLPPGREHAILKPAAQRLGLHPFDIPMLRNSVPYDGRAACMRCRWCVGFACEVDAKNGTQNTVIPKALASGNCELRAECVVKEIVTDNRGRAVGVAYFDSQDRLEIQPADLVVASCGATETARLLLNSQSSLFPQGLGNRNDWVGRNLQGHGYAGAYGLFADDVYDDVGPGASLAISRLQPRQPGHGGRWGSVQRVYPFAHSFFFHVSPQPAALGQGAQRLHAPGLPADRRGDGPGAGDAHVRLPGAGGPARQGLLGDTRGAPVRLEPPAHGRVGEDAGREGRRLA